MEAELNMQVAARLKMFTTNFISSRIVNELSTKVFRITGGEYQGLLKRVSESINNYKRVSKSINAYQRVMTMLTNLLSKSFKPKSIKEYERVSEFIKEYRSKKKDTACT